MVFLADSFEDDSDRQRLYSALRKYGGDRRKTEESFNVVEVPPLFGRNMGDTSEEEDLLLATILCSTWAARLREIYPDRKFDIEVLAEDDTLDGISVIFRQSHSK
jgi:hypothetical protein